MNSPRPSSNVPVETPVIDGVSLEEYKARAGLAPETRARRPAPPTPPPAPPVDGKPAAAPPPPPPVETPPAQAPVMEAPATPAPAPPSTDGRGRPDRPARDSENKHA